MSRVPNGRTGWTRAPRPTPPFDPGWLARLLVPADDRPWSSLAPLSQAKPQPHLFTHFEPFVREVARREGLDAGELVKETTAILQEYGGIWEEMEREGALR